MHFKPIFPVHDLIELEPSNKVFVSYTCIILHKDILL